MNRWVLGNATETVVRHSGDPVLVTRPTLKRLVFCRQSQEKSSMVEEKDRFGKTLQLLERAKEDIYFAQRDREPVVR